MKRTPRNTLQGTRAKALLQRDFYGAYLQARYVGAEDTELPNAEAVFTPEGIEQLRQHLSEAALQAPVVLTERLSNRILAVHLVQKHVERFVVSARFKVDTDVLAHTLIEEYVHSQQVLDKMDFEQQRQQFAYDQRPYELDAKRIAVFGNIFYKVRSGVLLGGGRDNTIDNNLFVNCSPAVHVDARGIGWAKKYIEPGGE